MSCGQTQPVVLRRGIKPANLKEAIKRADWDNTTIKEARVGSAHFISGNVKFILYHPFLFA